MTKFSTNQILEGIVSNDTRVLDHIYRSFFSVTLSFVKSQNGSKEDAFDIFQEAVVVILQRLRKGNLELDCSFGTFLQSIVKVLWMHQRVDNLKRLAATGYQLDRSNEGTDIDAELLNAVIENEKTNFVQRHFMHLSDGCQTLLQLYIENVSIREIADMMGVTEGFVKKKKYECKQKLIKRIMADTGYKNLFL